MTRQMQTKDCGVWHKFISACDAKLALTQRSRHKCYCADIQDFCKCWYHGTKSEASACSSTQQGALQRPVLCVILPF